jgi:hypothetical protein
MVLDGSDRIGAVIELRDYAAKNGSGRSIPTNADLIPQAKKRCDHAVQNSRQKPKSAKLQVRDVAKSQDVAGSEVSG